MNAHVKRGGVEKQIAAKELAPGDIVILESGGVHAHSFHAGLVRIAPVPRQALLTLALIALSVFVVTEIFKILRRDARLGKYL